MAVNDILWWSHVVLMVFLALYAIYYRLKSEYLDQLLEGAYVQEQANLVQTHLFIQNHDKFYTIREELDPEFKDELEKRMEVFSKSVFEGIEDDPTFRWEIMRQA